MAEHDHARDEARWSATEEAQELLRESLIDEAMRELRALVDGDRENPYAHFFLGAAFLAKGQKGFALAAYEAAERHHPGYLGAMVQQARVLYDLGRYEEAIARGRRVLDAHGADPDTFQVMGLSFAAIGRKHEAIAYLERFAGSNPSAEARFEAEAMITALRGKVKGLDDEG
ncbi:MAG: tetratricopeptide repeat protein [Myxococcales bacterium]|nr:tetratricopeptide repeat protein [Myxococcales bacterium]